MEVGFRRLMLLVFAELDNQQLNTCILSISKELSQADDVHMFWFVSDPILGGIANRDPSKVFEQGENYLRTQSFFAKETVNNNLIYEQHEKQDWMKFRDQAVRCVEKNKPDEFGGAIEAMADALQNYGWDQVQSAFAELAAQLHKLTNHGILPARYEKAVRERINEMKSRDALVLWLCQEVVQPTSDDRPIAVYGSVSTMEYMVSYIQNHYGENDLNLNKLANHLYISAAYLGKQFRTFTGMGFSEYLVKIRMERAADLLILKREASVAAIASEVGYSNSSYFTSSFKNYYGVNPSTYRVSKNLELNND